MRASDCWCQTFDGMTCGVCTVVSGGRIKVANPVVDLDGDEMTRIIWANIKDTVRSELGTPPSDYDAKLRGVLHYE